MADPARRETDPDHPGRQWSQGHVFHGHGHTDRPPDSRSHRRPCGDRPDKQKAQSRSAEVLVLSSGAKRIAPWT